MNEPCERRELRRPLPGPPGGGLSSVREGVYCTKQILALPSKSSPLEQSEVLRKSFCITNRPSPCWQQKVTPPHSPTTDCTQCFFTTASQVIQGLGQTAIKDKIRQIYHFILGSVKKNQVSKNNHTSFCVPGRPCCPEAGTHTGQRCPRGSGLAVPRHAQ